VILFELLTGKPPFNADAVTALAIKITNDPAPPLRALRASAPAGLEQAIAKCLAKDRANRFQNVADLAAALGDFGSANARASVERIARTLQKAGLTPNPLLVSTGDARKGTSAATATASSWGQETATTRSSRARVAVGAALLLLVFGVGGGVWLHTRPVAGATTENAAIDVTPAASGKPLPSELADPTPSAVEPSDPGAVATLAPPPSFAPTSATSRAPGRARPIGSSSSASTPATNAATGPSAKPAPNCNPPYVIDANGHRDYKPECLN
jgi:serine/threonine-protein kinase